MTDDNRRHVEIVWENSCWHCPVIGHEPSNINELPVGGYSDRRDVT